MPVATDSDAEDQGAYHYSPFHRSPLRVSLIHSARANSRVTNAGWWSSLEASERMLGWQVMEICRIDQWGSPTELKWKPTLAINVA